MKIISSKDNPQYKFWKRLTQSKGINDLGYFILSGEKLVQEAVHMYKQNHSIEISAEILTDDQHSHLSAPKCYRLPLSLFDSLDILGTHSPLLIIKTPELKRYQSTVTHTSQTSHAASHEEGLNNNLFQVIAPLGDPKNLGALIRSCAAFDVDQIVLTEESANPFLPNAIKAASLACLHLPMVQAGPLAELEGSFFALHQDGVPIDQIEWPNQITLLVGQEGQGLKKLSSKAQVTPVKIPIKSNTESLNAAVAASIALYEISKTRNHKL